MARYLKTSQRGVQGRAEWLGLSWLDSFFERSPSLCQFNHDANFHKSGRGNPHSSSANCSSVIYGFASASRNLPCVPIQIAYSLRGWTHPMSLNCNYHTPTSILTLSSVSTLLSIAQPWYPSQRLSCCSLPPSNIDVTGDCCVIVPTATKVPRAARDWSTK